MTYLLAAFDWLRSKRFFGACLLGFAIAAPAGAANVLPLYLDEIIDRSAVAFEGVCLENRSERDSATNMVVTYTTFEVRDVLKGNVGATHVIKQIGGSSPDQNLRFDVRGIPQFNVGESYVVFLAGVSSAGFSSPVGLAQGRFNIKQGAAGREVTNGRDFKDLTARLPEKAASADVKRAPGAVLHLDIDAFKQLVRERDGVQR